MYSEIPEMSNACLRKRKRAFRKVKRTNLVSDWNKFKKKYVIELFKIFAIPKNISRQNCS